MQQENPANPNYQPQDEDFSLKKLIHTGLDYFWLLWRNKWWIILAGLLGAGGMYLKSKRTPIKFGAPLTFALNEGDGGSGMSAISGLLGQFGLGGGGSAGGKVSADKIIALSKSMRIVNQALFDRVTIDGKDDYIANHIIEVYSLDKEWAKNNPHYVDFRFKHDALDSFSLEESSALKGVYGFTVGGLEPGLVTCIYDRESTIFTLRSDTEKEALSLELTNHLFEKLTRFYIQQSSDKQKQTYELIKAKADSLYKKWTGSEYAVSSSIQNQNALWSPVDRTQREIKGKQSTIYAMAYAESLKNLEIADYALKNSTPFIRDIDKPFFPLDATMPNWIRQSIIGMIIGLALGSAIIIGIKIVSDALKS